MGGFFLGGGGSDLVDVCRVDGGGEEFNGDFVTVGGGDWVLVKTSPGTTRCQRMFRRSRKLVDTSGRPAACRIWSRRELWPECIRIAKGACGESCAGRWSGSARTCDSCSGEFGVVVVVVEGWRGGGVVVVVVEVMSS